MLGHSQTKERATGNPNLGLNHRATSRLYCTTAQGWVSDPWRAARLPWVENRQNTLPQKGLRSGRRNMTCENRRTGRRNVTLSG